MANKICIVGTVHMDINGEKRLDYILDKYSPDIVAIELSEDRTRGFPATQKEKESRLEEDIKKANIGQGPLNPTLIGIAKELYKASGFEYYSPKKYVDAHPGTRLEYVDLSVFGEGDETGQKAMGELLNNAVKNIPPQVRAGVDQMMSRMGKDAFIATLQQRVDMAYKMQPLLGLMTPLMRSPRVLDQLNRTYPKESVDVIKKIVSPDRDEYMAKKIRELSPQGKVLVVCGLLHMKGIKKRLSDLHPRALSLLNYKSI